MSILNGAVSHQIIRPEPQPYGDALTELTFYPMRGALDLAVMGEYLVCAAERELRVYALSDTHDALLPVSVLGGLGESRQISISDGFAYVTARPDGIFVCDLRTPEAPVLACHLDSLELATGVCAADGLLAVVNRHMGCELWDVRDPYHPVRRGVFLCGEAQSVWLYGHYAVIGDWMNRRTRIFDISDPARAEECSRFSVDGFADGVCVCPRRDRILCFTATGHHAARLKNRRKYQDYTFVTPEMLAEGYGCGHGVEIFDITDPYDPEYLASCKAPPLFGGIDTWRVTTDGERCYFTDSMNGLFLIEWRDDPCAPFISHRFRCAPLEKQRVSPPSVQIQTHAVTGAAVLGDRLFAAASDGVHMLAAPAGCKPLTVPHCDVLRSPLPAAPADPDCVLYRDAGQLHTAVFHDSRLYCADGNGGIVILDRSGKLLARHETPDICHDLLIDGDHLYTAEGLAGAACYEISPDGLCECSRVHADGRSVRQIVRCGAYFAAAVGSNAVILLRAEDGVLSSVGRQTPGGLLYYRHLSRTDVGGCLCAFPLSGGPALYRCGENGLSPAFTRWGKEICPFADGACGDGDRLIFLLNGKYLALDTPEDLASVSEADFIAVEGARLSGTPFVFGDRLLILNRCTGIVEELDVADRHAPRFLRRFDTGSYPESAAVINGKLYIACGVGGLRVY